MKNIYKKTIATLLFSFISISTFAQDITGTITNIQNTPIKGANIIIKGTKINATSDVAGQFSIAIPDQLPLTLLVQFAGYETKEINITALPEAPLEIQIAEENELLEVVITSRRRTEKLQNVPIPISVISGTQADQASAFNVNRLKELLPSVQLYSSNPRNTGINIRGLGSPFGLTNDGIDPGVGFYVDGVYYARPAAATLDFIDIAQVEVLRGPQGTLYGKNTTAGTFNIKTKSASFTTGADFEVSYGNFGFLQAKTSVTGKLANNFAGRLSFSGTQRDGLIENIATGRYTNELNNQGFRGQLLFTPTENIDITLIADYTSQRPDGYAQVVAGVAPTQRADYRQFDAIIADLNYSLPTTNAFERIIDHDTPWRSNQQLGGASLNVEAKIGAATLTSTTAWRFATWDPSNDRDFTGLQALSKSENPSKQQQFTQEVRYAGQVTSKLSGVVGLFYINQSVVTNGTEESGDAQWRFSQSTTSPNWETPGLLNGYGINTDSDLRSSSAAIFGQVDWAITERLHVLPGLRYNYDKKKVDYNRAIYGGLETTDPALIAIQRSVYSNQAFNADVDDTNFSGNITVAYAINDKINTFATYAKSYKPVGMNVGGLPSLAGVPMLELAVVLPEEVNHYEIGVKTSPFTNSILNLTLFNTDIKNYQTQVQSPELSVNRGYLANAAGVRVRGAELDASVYINKYFNFNGAISYTDGIYTDFQNAPLPLEETGAKVAFKDISGSDLPGISRWAGTLGGEYSVAGNLFGNNGKYFFGLDAFYRSEFSSSPSPSIYLVVPSYALFNARAGFKVADGLSVWIWGRNIFDKDYYEQLLPAGGNAGQYAAVLGDQRTVGITFKYSL